MKDIINIDSNGKLHGEYISYFPNGQLCTKTTCIQDMYHGEYINYLPNGRINAEAIYDHGVIKSFKRPRYTRNGDIVY